ncbi:uncharacterized protein LOC124281582 [Haliotis rubra]|uniref:uncharacterized protein LOC124281582 n=1 Tax=Haliotis rubra TaxID=36100 RepID=UPI001EE51195|nr:uncharacterized protein LOC124281582 [Haliotis rubra]
MNAVAVVALYVTLVLMVSRDVHPATPCPRSCMVDVQVLSCRRLITKDLPVLGSCVEDLPLIAVVDLKYNKITCSCEFLKLSKALLQSKIILFHSTKCSSKIIKGCHAGQYNSTRHGGSYFHVAGALFNVGSSKWRRRFDRHYKKLWNILTRIEDAGTRHFYLVRLMGIIRKMEWRMDKKAFKAEQSLKGSDNPKGTNSSSKIEKNKFVSHNLVQEGDDSRKAKVVIFSSIIGAAVLIALVILICKLESDRRIMLKAHPMGDLYVDPKLQTRIWSWRNFLTKLQCYKRDKAEQASRLNAKSQSTGRVFVQQSKVEPRGQILVQENGPAAAVTSLTKMIPQQPFLSYSHTHQAGSSRSLSHQSGTSFGSSRFEPIGLSSQEPSSDALCGESTHSKQSLSAAEELEAPLIAQRIRSTGGGYSDENIPASVEDNLNID